MTKPFVSSAAILFSVIGAQAPATIDGWMHRPRFSASCISVRSKNGGGGGRGDARQQKVSLSAHGDGNDDDHRKINDGTHLPGGEDHESEDDSILPLFAEDGEKQHQLFHLDLSRLEAIYDMDLELFNGEDKSDSKSHRLLSGERVILGDWMSWDEGKCLGDFCGDEFDVSALFSPMCSA